MNYNINFQVAAVIITALLLYHFLTQKKLHNANVKTFTYILVLSGLYILSDLLGTLTIMNYTAEDEGIVMGILTGIYLLDILIPYILYSCIPDSRENEKKSGALSVICAGITVAMMIAVLGNLGSGGFFCFDSNDVFQKGTGYVFLYLYALVYIVLIMQRMIRSREDYTPEKMSIAGEFLVIEGVCIGVELYTGYIFLSGFGLALGLIFLYLMMNNPGDYIDSTTGAFDKRYFDNWIQEKFTKGIEFHVIAVELFMLKQINKVYGSSTGDLLLVQIARELQNITGSVQVFRTTGNCFLIITDSLTEYEKNRQEIENYFKEPFETDGEKITFPAIICGIINGEKMEKEDVLLAYIEYLISLVKRADETVVIQSDDRILEGFRYEKEVEHFLKTAVDKDLFEVYYQPVFWTKEDRYITLEALSRLKHPCMGMIPPDVFISIAERQGLIAQIGLLQFRRVCRFIKENEYMMKQIKNVKFNLSPSELLKPGHSQLLINIFEKNTPLHDGAVVIRDGRIAAAGCVLPLTSNTNLSPDLGTRHRAGIGMSEHSDAVIVIVSEETGGISIAVDGMLKRRLSPDTFEAILRSELVPAEEQQRRRWDIIVDFVKKLNPLRREKQHDKKDDDQQNSQQ